MSVTAFRKFLPWLMLSIPLSVISIPAQANPVVPSSTGTGFGHGDWVKSSAGGIISAPSKIDMTHTHVGLDIQAMKGSSIRAFASGIVTKTIDRAVDCAHPKSPTPEWCYLGYMVLIRHPAGLDRPFYTLYLHLAEAPLVQTGDRIEALQEIGFVGDTGATSGHHTHFEIRYFSSVIFPAWGNIYGPGDQTRSEAFLNEWLDPQSMFEKYPDGVSRTALLSETNSMGQRASEEGYSISVDQDSLARVVSSLASSLGVLLIMLSGFALLFATFISKRIAGTLFFYGVLLLVMSEAAAILGPSWILSASNFISSLPLSVIIIVGGLLVISAMQAFVALFLGWNAANSFAGNLTASLFKSVFTLLIAPLKLLKRLLGNTE